MIYGKDYQNESERIRQKSKKKLEVYKKNYILNKRETSTIAESYERLENREKKATEVNKEDPKNFYAEMMEFSEDNFYLFEHLVYWQNINEKKLSDCKNRAENPFGELLPKVINELEQLVEVGKEMLERCIKNEITNVKLNKTAVKEVIEQISAETYKVCDSIKKMRDMSNQQAEKYTTVKERNTQSFDGKKIPKMVNKEFSVELGEKLESIRNGSIGNKIQENKMADQQSTKFPQITRFQRVKRFISGKFLVGKKHKVTTMSDVDKKTMSNIKETLSSSKKEAANRMKQAFIDYR